jgi:perosamine synthetase
MYKYPLANPDLGELEAQSVAEAVRGGWVSARGPQVAEFENKFAAHCGAAHAVATCNGTAALQLSLASLGIGQGDEVIVPTLTYVASVSAAIYLGATPVLVDVDSQTACIDPRELEGALSPRTRAIIAVHLYGIPVDLDAVASVATPRGVAVVEDAAEALDTFYKGKRVGTIGRVGIFSFFANKLITTGEGGMLVTNDGELARNARHLYDHASDRTNRYWHDRIGYNFRMSNLQAALGLAQLSRVAMIESYKLAIIEAYRQQLCDVEEISLPTHPPWSGRSRFLCGVLFKNREVREAVSARLAENGVETHNYFQPVHLMPAFRERCRMPTGASYAVAEDFAARGLCLPSGPRLSLAEIREICGLLRSALRDVAR